jgi:methylmalonyl-CoA mutase
MYDLLQEKRQAKSRFFGGGGGVILPSEIAELQAYGITKFMLQMTDVPWDYKV